MSHLIKSSEVAYPEFGSEENAKNHSARVGSSQSKGGLQTTVEKAVVKTEQDDESLRAVIENQENNNGNSKELEEEMERCRQEAYQDGFESGFEEGKEKGNSEGLEIGFQNGLEEGKKGTKEKIEKELEQADEDVRKHANKLKVLARELQQQITKQTRNLEPVAIEIVFEVVLRILGRKAADSSLISTIVNNLIEQAVDETISTIALSTMDYQVALDKGGLAEVCQHLNNIEVVSDQNLALGSCIIKTNSGELEARLDQQLEKFKEYLVETHHQQVLKSESEK